jgi:hypothetical protein
MNTLPRLLAPALALLLAGCLATPAAVEPPVVSSSELRGNYRGVLTGVLVVPPPTEAAAQRGSLADAGLQAGQRAGQQAGIEARLDAAVQRRLRAAGVPTVPVQAAPRGAQDPGLGRLAREHRASHLVRISVPEGAASQPVQWRVELRDTLTRTVVWRYAGELDTGRIAAAERSGERTVERMADAVIHRLREDGLLAR